MLSCLAPLACPFQSSSFPRFHNIHFISSLTITFQPFICAEISLSCSELKYGILQCWNLPEGLLCKNIWNLTPKHDRISEKICCNKHNIAVWKLTYKEFLHSAVFLYSTMFKPEKEETPESGDPLFDLLCCLSNVTHLYSHLSSQDFRPPSSDQQPHSEVTETFHEVTQGLEEAIRFMFQQTVYSVTKVRWKDLCFSRLSTPPLGWDSSHRGRKFWGS